MNCRSAFRNHNDSGNGNNNIGFRVLLVLPAGGGGAGGRAAVALDGQRLVTDRIVAVTAKLPSGSTDSVRLPSSSYGRLHEVASVVVFWRRRKAIHQRAGDPRGRRLPVLAGVGNSLFVGVRGVSEGCVSLAYAAGPTKSRCERLSEKLCLNW
jgi:hypothetical protein